MWALPVPAWEIIENFSLQIPEDEEKDKEKNKSCWKIKIVQLNNSSCRHYKFCTMLSEKFIKYVALKTYLLVYDHWSITGQWRVTKTGDYYVYSQQLSDEHVLKLWRENRYWKL